MGGKPLRGVVLEFETHVAGGSTSEDAVTTDDEGAFRLVLPHPGTYEARAVSPTMRGEARASIDVGAEELRNVMLRFPSGSLRGRVVDAEGAPVLAGPVILLRPRNLERSRPLWSVGPYETLARMDLGEDAGRFSFSGLSAGQYLLRIAPEEHVAQEVPVELDLDSDVTLPDIVVHEGNRLRVTLLGPAGEIPAFAHIAAFRDGNLGSMAGAGAAKVDDRGRAELAGLQAGPYTLVAMSPGWPPLLVDDVVVTKDQTATMEITLRRGGVLDVLVVSRDDSRPVPDARVRVLAAGDRDLTPAVAWFGLVSLATGQTGEVGLRLGSGLYSLELQPPLRAKRTSASVVQGKRTSVTLYAE